MVKTMKEFKETIEKLRDELKGVYNKRLLNGEGIDTLKAYNALIHLAAFYDDLKEFARLEDVQDIFDEYNDCKEIRHIKWFLEKVAK